MIKRIGRILLLVMVMTMASCRTYDSASLPGNIQMAPKIEEKTEVTVVEEVTPAYRDVVLPSYDNESINLYEYTTPPTDKFTDVDFMVASDIHFLSEDLYDNGGAYKTLVETSNGQMQYQGKEILEAFIEKVIEREPDYLILTGDLTVNGEKLSHIKLAQMLSGVEKHGIDVLIVPGNHDINNVYARSFFGNEQQVTDYVDFVQFSNIYANLGPDVAKFKHDKSFSYVVEKDNVWFMMIDSAIYEYNVGQGYPESAGELSDSQAQWFEEILNLADQENKEMMTFMHHNMVAHADVSPLYLGDFMVAGASHGTSQYLASRDMNVVFSGHIHCHDIAGIRYDDTFIYDITTGALITYPHNYRVCTVSEKGTLSIKTKTITTIKSDPNFGAFSKNQAYQKRGGFGKVEGASEADAIVMQAYANTVANAYFEGTDDKIFDNRDNISGYALWQSQTGRTSEMILGMSHDTEPRDRDISIDLNTGYWLE